MRALTVRLGALVLGLLVLGACGYSSRRLTDFSGARTISVLPFENTGFRRDVELRLTQAVADEIRARTSYALSSADQADLLLKGSMGAGEQIILQDDDRQPILKRLEGSMTVTIVDRCTGAVVRTYAVTDLSEFAPGRFGQSLDAYATDEWTRRMAQRVVQGLERDF